MPLRSFETTAQVRGCWWWSSAWNWDHGVLFQHTVHLAQCLSFHSAVPKLDAQLGSNTILTFVKSCFESSVIFLIF